ncbi:Alpha/Beta hydrolase fold [Amanita muscaria]
MTAFVVGHLPRDPNDSFQAYCCVIPQKMPFDEQHKTLASEKEDNFRWLARLFATYSDYKLGDTDLASKDVSREVTEYGQFSEVVYSAVPVDTLIKNFRVLHQAGYPLEHYDALGDCELIDSVRGTVGDLPALILFRPRACQLVVSISGTASLLQALYDVRMTKTAHPSGCGAVHSGFWALYCGLKDQLMERIWHTIEERHPAGLIFTGHSMGGSLAYLLLLDFLAKELSQEHSILSTLTLRIAVIGAPRAGDAKLVNYFHSLLKQYRERFKIEITEYSVQGYNDGIPAVPPPKMGFRHFCQAPLFTGGGKLYRTPASNQSQVMFYPPEDTMQLFPMGGHNYHNATKDSLVG